MVGWALMNVDVVEKQGASCGAYTSVFLFMAVTARASWSSALPHRRRHFTCSTARTCSTTSDFLYYIAVYCFLAPPLPHMLTWPFHPQLTGIEAVFPARISSALPPVDLAHLQPLAASHHIIRCVDISFDFGSAVALCPATNEPVNAWAKYTGVRLHVGRACGVVDAWVPLN